MDSKATVEILVQGVGLRLNDAPLGICTVALITAADGSRVLVDTGLHQTREIVLRELATRDLDCDDIDTVVLTHLHYDHCENARLFAGSRLIVHEDETRECEEDDSRDAYIADFWHELTGSDNVSLMTGHEWQLTQGVTIYHMPGHRRGQLVVAAETDHGRVVCSSDAAKNARELLLGEASTYDPAMRPASRQSVARILGMADLVIPGHDRPLRIVDGRPLWNEDQTVALRFY